MHRALRQGKPRRPAGAADGKEHRGGAARPDPIQRRADRDLHQRKDQEPDARGSGEVIGTGADVAFEHLGQHGKERAKELAEHIAQRQQDQTGVHVTSLETRSGLHRAGAKTSRGLPPGPGAGGQTSG